MNLEINVSELLCYTIEKTKCKLSDKKKKLMSLLVRYSIIHGVDIHYNDDIALVIASEAKDLSTVKFLLERGSYVHGWEDQAFINACENNDLEMVKLLYEYGSDIHCAGAERTFEDNQLDTDYPLQTSCFYGHIDIVYFLLERGANIYANSNSPFYNALEQEQFQVLKLLSEYIK